MDLSIREVIRAARASGSFAELFRGAPLESNKFGNPILKVTETCDSIRQVGYRFSRHSVMAKVESNSGEFAYGYGEACTHVLALQKAIAEGAERCASAIANRFDPTVTTSNGWAAHLTREEATKNASTELLERDTVLAQWLGGVRPFEISTKSLPSALKVWISSELALAPRFNKIKFTVSSVGEIPVITAFLHDDRMYGFFSHAAGPFIDQALNRCVAEACRLADLFTKGLIRESTGAAEKHIVHFAELTDSRDYFAKALTTSFASAKADWIKSGRAKPSVSDFEFDFMKCGPLHIVQCRSETVQNLFFGPTQNAERRGQINKVRLANLTGVKVLNGALHFVA